MEKDEAVSEETEVFNPDTLSANEYIENGLRLLSKGVRMQVEKDIRKEVEEEMILKMEEEKKEAGIVNKFFNFKRI